MTVISLFVRVLVSIVPLKAARISRLVWIFILCVGWVSAQKVIVKQVEANTAQLGLYETLELKLSTEVPTDPYDPMVIPIIMFTSPLGKTFSIAAFWYQDFDRVTLQPLGTPHYRIRFTPIETGIWQTDRGFSFEVTKSNKAGFLRVDASNERYLAYDDGAPFFGIGLNLAWSNANSLTDYEQWFDKMEENGANLSRVWMASWSFGIEWQDTGLGDYTLRLKQAWLLDQVFRMAEKRGVVIMLVINNHGAFSKTSNAEWENNPYNMANGGPCAEPQCFVEDDVAKAFFKKRLSYISARYAYAPNLIWEWWNEVNLTPISLEKLSVWLDEMTSVLKHHDHYGHLITNSFSGGNYGGLWDKDSLNIMQIHLYETRDPCLNSKSSYEGMASKANKPIIFGENGASGAMEDKESLDKDGIHLHNGLWATSLSRFASTSMYWWWDSYITPLDLWHHYGALSRFLEGENLARYSLSQVEKSADICVKALQRPDRVLGWVRSADYTAESITQAYTKLLRQKIQPGPDWVYVPEVVSEQFIPSSFTTRKPQLR
jgi:hypothetical protein